MLEVEEGEGWFGKNVTRKVDNGANNFFGRIDGLRMFHCLRGLGGCLN